MKTFDAPLYLQIRPTVSAPRRLAELRNLAAKGSGDWRKAREWNFTNWHAAFCALSQGSNSDANGKNARPIWYAHTGPQFRDERYADEVDTSIEHEGWFTDNDQGEKMRGLVARLPHGRFLAGYWSSDSGERTYFADLFTDEREAARRADREAEIVAESEREYDERYRAAQDLAEEIDKAEQRARELVAMRNLCGFEYVRDELRELLETIREKRAELATEYKDIQL
jgi:hypothetical protein